MGIYELERYGDRGINETTLPVPVPVPWRSEAEHATSSLLTEGTHNILRLYD